MSEIINNALNIPLFGKLGKPIFGKLGNPVYGDVIFGTRIYVCFGYNNVSTMPYDHANAQYVDPTDTDYTIKIGSAGLPAQGFVSGDFTGYDFVRSTEYSLTLDKFNGVASYPYVSGSYSAHAFSFKMNFSGYSFFDADFSGYSPTDPEADGSGWVNHTGLGYLAIIDPAFKFGACVFSDTYGILATEITTGNVNTSWGLFAPPPITDRSGFITSWAPATPELKVTNYRTPA